MQPICTLAFEMVEDLEVRRFVKCYVVCMTFTKRLSFEYW